MGQRLDATDALVNAFEIYVLKARDVLIGRMLSQGMRIDEGWSIREELRTTSSGTLIVLRPVHMHLPDPGLEQSVSVDLDGKSHAIDQK